VVPVNEDIADFGHLRDSPANTIAAPATVAANGAPMSFDATTTVRSRMPGSRPCAPAQQHEPVFKTASVITRSVGTHGHHELGLHIGGKPGKGMVLILTGLRRLGPAIKACCPDFNHGTHLRPFCNYGLLVFGNAVFDL
jgi:hypothetical protein